MGFHDALMDRLEPALEGKQLTPPGDGMLFKTGGTANFRAMGWGTEYLRTGDKFWRDWLMKQFFEEQWKNGFMCLKDAVEQFCADPHMNFWICAVLGMRQGAKKYGHQDVLDATTKWLHSLSSLVIQGMRPDGWCIMPASRTESPTPNQMIASMLVNFAVNGKLIGPAKKPAKLLVRDFAAVRVGIQMVQAGDKLGMSSQPIPVKLRYPITFKKLDGGHEAFIADWSHPPGLANLFVTYVHTKYAQPRESFEVRFAGKEQ